ncbi:MAG TPA: hypothetical protein VHK27_06055, partial [Gammaproteobacteria bacterium]|nr:hypothetical protein [Gammaproteobacteria bacterium]
MPELAIKRAEANSLTRIELCLPRVFPWKLRGGDRPRHGGYHKELSPRLEGNYETFADTNRGYSYF